MTGRQNTDGAEGRILVICPTARDRRHFNRPDIRSAYDLEFLGTDEVTHTPGFDASGFLRGAIRHVAARPGLYRAVIGIDDFPASIIASLIAERFGFVAPSFRSLFQCQHKYYSRLAQREIAPGATPRFQVLLASNEPAPSDLLLEFPFFLKPVKSYLSIMARRIDRWIDLSRAVSDARIRLAPVSRMFDALVHASALDDKLRGVPGSALVVEELLTGHQVTLDGYVFEGKVVPLGIVDSIFFPNTSSFERFEYPSRLSPDVQEKMARIAGDCVRHIGLDYTFFDMEFFYSEESESIGIIEINGRMSSQFAPLYSMVDGIDLYAMQLEIALGKDPGGAEVWGSGRNQGKVSSSFVLRRFEDAYVRRVPGEDDIQALQCRFPECFVEILVSEGERLSDELQDDTSYRYALVDLCAESWEVLYKRFEEAKEFLHFDFRVIGDGRPTPREIYP